MKEEFKPYIPADKVIPEITPASLITGLLLAVVFGAANAYLALRVGVTVSASIPAAVISMAVIRVVMRRDSILESNMVQTIGSAGESLAAGAVFTLPALFIWASEGLMSPPSLIALSIIALCGGLLGVFFMVPLRNALIVQEHGVLPYPEGTACAEVLLAGEEGGSSAKYVFSGMFIGGVVKLIVDGFAVVQSSFTVKLEALKTEFSANVYPALVAVGYICGLKISSYMFAGGVLAWFVLIPTIVTFGSDLVLYPAKVSIAEVYASGGASAVWSAYVKYIGAGSVASAGIISLIKSLPLIIKSFKQSLSGLKNTGSVSTDRTSIDLDLRIVIGGIVILIFAIWLIPVIPVSFIGAVFIAIFGFFFCAVGSRMVGLVGSSNNPVSGMAIASLLFVTMCLKALGDSGIHGMQGAIIIAAVISIGAGMAGDMSQDLKTGYILGATPKKQQIGEILGALAASISIGGVLMLLDRAYGYGTNELSAPQATLMKMIVESVMKGNLPWSLIFIGVFISIVIELLGVGALPVAIGLYLPLELSATIMLGGLIRYLVTRKNGSDNNNSGSGVLFSSGLIAGEGIVGVLLAVFSVTGLLGKMDLSGVIPTGNIQALIVLAAVTVLVYLFAVKKNEK